MLQMYFFNGLFLHPARPNNFLAFRTPAYPRSLSILPARSTSYRAVWLSTGNNSSEDIEKVDLILLLNKKSIDSYCPQLNTEVIGVIIIHIHQAMGLEKMDARDASGEYCLFHGYIVYTDIDLADPYVTVTVAYSR